LSNRILGYTWKDIQRASKAVVCGKHLPPTKAGQDYGANPMGDGTFQMLPSGDIVDLAERNRRLQR
jgi:hypothetical protein